MQNIDDTECLKSCLFKYLHPADSNSAWIRKVDKDFPREPDFKDIKFPVKTIDIHKTEKMIYWY